MEKLKYPIGKFVLSEVVTTETINDKIKVIEKFPAELKKEVENLNSKQLDTRYRNNGWTIRQVIHHCADSHLNGFTRFKLALTENNPIIKPYIEEKWAELIDAKNTPISSSLQIIEGLHCRWTFLLNSLSEIEFQKKIYHPKDDKEYTLSNILFLYAWHCKHHLKHITNLKKLKKWNTL